MKHAHVQPSTRSSLSPTLLRALSGSAVSVALLLFAVAAAAQPIDLDKAASYFAEAKALSDRDAGELWGIELYGPMLFVDPATRFVVANTQDKGGVLTAADHERTLFIGTLPPEVNVANTTVDWSGTRWAMVMWPLPRSRSLMMHESFHRIQRDLGLPLSIRNNAHLDTADGRGWLRLEWSALEQALHGDAPLESVYLEHALIFRERRRQLFRLGLEEERAMEMNEGLAEYTGLRLLELEPSGMRQWLRNILTHYGTMDQFSQSFAYASGPVYGFLLDLAMPDWRDGVSEDTDLVLMLRRAVGFELPENLAEVAMELARPHGGQHIFDEERARAHERTERTDGHRKTFVTGPVLRLPMSGQTNFTFDPHGAETLDGLGTVYAAMRITGPFGVLESTGPVLWVTETEQSRNQHFRVPAPENPRDIPHDARTIETDGWTLTLNPGWRFRRTNAKGDCVIEES